VIGSYPDATIFDQSNGSVVPKSRRQLVLRISAEAFVAPMVVFLLAEFFEGRRAGEWNYQANLYQALVPLSFGLMGWWMPRLAAWMLFVLAGLLALGGLLWGGPVGLVLGVPPLIPGLLFYFSRNPRPRGHIASGDNEGAEPPPAKTNALQS
jgi:hypothetical protein